MSHSGQPVDYASMRPDGTIVCSDLVVDGDLYATVKDHNIEDGSITADKLVDGSITSSKLTQGGIDITGDLTTTGAIEVNKGLKVTGYIVTTGGLYAGDSTTGSLNVGGDLTVTGALDATIGEHNIEDRSITSSKLAQDGIDITGDLTITGGITTGTGSTVVVRGDGSEVAYPYNPVFDTTHDKA